MDCIDASNAARHRLPGLVKQLVSVPLLLGWLAAPVSAQDANTVNGTQCIGQRALADGGYALNCTANDIRIASAEILPNADGVMPACPYPGAEIEFKAMFTVESSASERYDIGLWFSEDGDPNNDGALTGTCSASTLPSGPSPFLNIDAASQPGDTCGDIKKPGSNPLYPIVTVKATCTDFDQPGDPGYERLDLPYCTSWRQQGSNQLCTTPLQAFPGAPSKCKCDRTFDVGITVPPAKLRVTKEVSSPSVSEPGEDVTFTVTVYNDGVDPVNTVTLLGLTDKIVNASGAEIESLGSLFTIDKGSRIKSTTCVKGTVIAAQGGSYSCEFTTYVGGDADATVHDRVEASGTDTRNNPLDGSANAQVSVTDARPDITVTKSANKTSVTEPGGDVEFTVTVTNTSPAGAKDPIAISSLVDDIYDNLNNKGTCNSLSNPYPSTLASGSSYTCKFTAYVAGNGKTKTSETNIITATVYDEDGTAPYVEASNPWTVAIVPVGSAITVVKQVSYNGGAFATSVDVPETPAPGVVVSYRVVITNTSLVDDVTIHSLTDKVNNAAPYGVGTVPGATNCGTPFTLAKNGGYRTCTFSLKLYGNWDDSHVNLVEASGLDDDGDPVKASDSASVKFVNVPPTAVLTKTATRALVTYEVTVTNTSTAEPLFLYTLIDDKFGDVTQVSDDIESTDCSASSREVAIGETYRCKFQAYVENVAANLPHVNTVEATIGDDDGNDVTPNPSDTAKVDLE